MLPHTKIGIKKKQNFVFVRWLWPAHSMKWSFCRRDSRVYKDQKWNFPLWFWCMCVSKLWASSAACMAHQKPMNEMVPHHVRIKCCRMGWPSPTCRPSGQNLKIQFREEFLIKLRRGLIEHGQPIGGQFRNGTQFVRVYFDEFLLAQRFCIHSTFPQRCSMLWNLSKTI